MRGKVLYSSAEGIFGSKLHLTSESLPFPGGKKGHFVFANERVKLLLMHSISSIYPLGLQTVLVF